MILVVYSDLCTTVNIGVVTLLVLPKNYNNLLQRLYFLCLFIVVDFVFSFSH